MNRFELIMITSISGEAYKNIKGFLNILIKDQKIHTIKGLKQMLASQTKFQMKIKKSKRIVFNRY